MPVHSPNLPIMPENMKSVAKSGKLPIAFMDSFVYQNRPVSDITLCVISFSYPSHVIIRSSLAETCGIEMAVINTPTKNPVASKRDAFNALGIFLFAFNVIMINAREYVITINMYGA